MPPLEKSIMSETVDKLSAILHRMETTQETNEKQLRMYRETIDQNIEFQEERISRVEKQWSSLRNTVITVIGILFFAVMGGSVSISNKVSKEEMDTVLLGRDCASKTDVVQGINSAVDDLYNSFERETDMTHDEARSERTESKLKVYKEVTGYKSRGVKK